MDVGRDKMKRDRQRHILITGGTRGIGLACAEHFATEDARLLLNYRRDEAQAATACRRIEELGAKAEGLACDLGNLDAIDAMVEKLGDSAIDVLIVNAAATAFKPLENTGPHNIAKTFDITVRGFTHLVQRTVPLMPPGSSIVAVSGFDAIRVIERHATLGAAKAAMETLVRYMAVEFAPRGLRVNGVSPGYIDTKSAQIYAGVERYEQQKATWT